VIDRGIVDVLNGRVHTVEKSLTAMRDTNRRQSDELALWTKFTDEGRDQLLVGALKDTPVLIVGVDGIDRRPVEDLRHELTVAQARLEGTLWLDRKLRLDSADDTKALASVLGIAADRADVARQQFVTSLATRLAPGGGPPELLNTLQDANFIDFEAPPGAPSGSNDLAPIPVAGTDIVLVSGAGAQVADDQVAVPLTQNLVRLGAGVLAAESGKDTPGGRSVFVGRLRSNGDLASKLSSVDDLESFMGQAAAVLAIGDLAAPHFGHFGVGPDAQRLLPAGASP
jgi:hypothetical protein